MFKHVIGGISIASVLDKRRKCANGEYPVRIRVHYQKNKKYYPTGKTCSDDVWQRLPNAKAPELIEMRNDIQTCFNNIKQHVLELYGEDNFTFDNLDRSISRSSGQTLNALLEEKISELRRSGQAATMDSYMNTLSNVIKYRGHGIPVENITEEWLKGFDDFLASRSRSVATIAINMRNIRTIMNVAKKAGFIKEHQYPFGVGKYEIKTAEGIKKALTIEQVRKIQNFKCDDDKLMMFRDLWLFIYYCNGINIADLILLKYSDIIDGEICFIREKTKRTTKSVKHIKAVVTKKMQAIIDRWGNEPEPDNYIFSLVEHSYDPEINLKRKNTFTKTFNSNTRLVGAAVGVYDITSYTARHTYATVLKRKGANIAFISESMGHTSLNTTQAYLDSFDKEERIKNAELLESL